MTQQAAKSIRVGTPVVVRSQVVRNGEAMRGVITAIDKPGREFGVKIGREWFTVFNHEIEVA